MTSAKEMHEKIVHIIDEKVNMMNEVRDKILEMNVPELYKGPLTFIKSTTNKLNKYTEAVSGAYIALKLSCTRILCYDRLHSELCKRESRVKDHVLNQDIPEMAQDKMSLCHEAMQKLNMYYKLFNEEIICFPFAKSKQDELTRILYTRIEADLINKLQKVYDDDYCRRKALIQAVKWPKVKNEEISSKQPRLSIPGEWDHNRKKALIPAEERLKVVNDGTSSKRRRSSIPEERDHNSKKTLTPAEERMKVVNDGAFSKRTRSSIPEGTNQTKYRCILGSNIQRDNNRKKAMVRIKEEMKVVKDGTSSKRLLSSIPEDTNLTESEKLISSNRPDPQLQKPAPEFVNRHYHHIYTTETSIWRVTERKRQQTNNHRNNERVERQCRHSMHYWVSGDGRLYY